MSEVDGFQYDGDGWVRHDDGDCPLLPETPVEILYRDGDVSIGKAGSFPRILWHPQWESDSDIIAYRVVEEPHP